MPIVRTHPVVSPRLHPRSYFSLALLFMLAAGCTGEPDAGPPQEPPPVPVRVAAIEHTSVDAYREYPGRVRGAREVEVWARVQGILEERLYDEGAIVEAGAPLFRIERAPFEVAVKTAEADRATAQAAFRQAEREWRRVDGLYEQDAVSERERDAALGAFELAQAQVLASDARVEQAQLDLDYTDVVSPQTGATSLEAVPEGSLVGPGTKLATVVQLDPAHVYFALPESDALIQRVTRNGHPDGRTREASLILPDGSAFERTGTVDFTASTVDPATGTVSIRAVFENPDRALVPGQFVRVRVLLQSFASVVVVPEEVVGQGPEGAQVFVANEDDATAAARPVQLGPVVPEGQIVLDGLEPGDRLVVDGHARLFDGADIEIRDTDEAAS